MSAGVGVGVCSPQTTEIMTIDTLIDAGRQQVRAREACQQHGGHYRDRETTVNGQPAWKCRCGLSAPKTARIWQDQQDRP